MNKRFIIFLATVSLAVFSFANLTLASSVIIFDRTGGGFTSCQTQGLNDTTGYPFVATTTGIVSDLGFDYVRFGANNSITAYLELTDASNTTLLATSDIFTEPTSSMRVTSTFSGGNQVILSLGTTYNLRFRPVDSGKLLCKTGDVSANPNMTVIGSDILPATLSFVYPTNGTSTTLFNPWLLSAANVNSSDLYRVDLNWYSGNYSPTGPFQNQLSNTVFVLGSQILSSGISIPRFEWNFDFATNTVITAAAKLYDTSDSNGDSLAVPTLEAQSHISFTLLSIPNGNYEYKITSSTGSGTYSQSTTTADAILLTQSTTTYECQAPSGITDIGGGINWAACRTLQFAFISQFPRSAQYFDGQLNSAKTAFPFGTFFSAQAALQSAASTTISSTSDPYLVMPIPIQNGSSSFNLLSSSTFSNTLGSSFKNQLFTVEQNALWLFTGWRMIMTIL